LPPPENGDATLQNLLDDSGDENFMEA